MFAEGSGAIHTWYKMEKRVPWETPREDSSIEEGVPANPPHSHRSGGERRAGKALPWSESPCGSRPGIRSGTSTSLPPRDLRAHNSTQI